MSSGLNFKICTETTRYKDAGLSGVPFQNSIDILQAQAQRWLQLSEECGALSSDEDEDEDDGFEKSALKAENIGLPGWLALSTSLLVPASSPSSFTDTIPPADSHGFFDSSVGN